MSTDPWSMVRGERQDLAELLETLAPDEWDAQSLCTDWRVRDVVAHLTLGPTMTAPKMMAAVIRSGFRLNSYISADGRRRGSRPTDTLLAEFRSIIPNQSLPPRFTPTTMLVDITVHQLDIRRPLGRSRAILGERAVAVADYLRGDRFLGGRKLTAGIRLRATDVDWTAGDGPEVTGPGEALLLTLAGRFAALDELDGEGLALLKQRSR